MKPGEVVRWAGFPFQKEGPAKPRWLICLGKVSIFGQEAIFYLATTTTKLEYYQPGGKREKHPHFVIQKKLAPCFDADCLVDLRINRPEEFKESVINQHSGVIEPKGILPNAVLAELFAKIVRAECLPKKQLQAIRESLAGAGFTGLAKP
ncbi:MAG: hypothetical protein GX442_13285 [Candidatus Riflebacteria bacterium]|nr:hypothetical protein [Candidatus Riflebacteria bacterium]